MAGNALCDLVYRRWLLCHLLVIKRPCRPGNDALSKSSCLTFPLWNVRHSLVVSGDPLAAIFGRQKSVQAALVKEIGLPGYEWRGATTMRAWAEWAPIFSTSPGQSGNACSWTSFLQRESPFDDVVYWAIVGQHEARGIAVSVVTKFRQDRQQGSRGRK